MIGDEIKARLRPGDDAYGGDAAAADAIRYAAQMCA